MESDGKALPEVQRTVVVALRDPRLCCCKYHVLALAFAAVVLISTCYVIIQASFFS
jgi:hypothetical protein